ncbi:MAG: amidohydrolase family protein [Candidatus Binatia bacterium]
MAGIDAGYISADGHVVEPADLWTTRLDWRFRDRAPRVDSRPNGDMDHWWEDHRHWMEPKVDEMPSFYFRRQFWATFEDDRAGVLTRELIGVDRLMWGSDYPHTEGTFPHSREQVAKDFAGIPEADVYQMVAGNAARLYRLST